MSWTEEHAQRLTDIIQHHFEYDMTPKDVSMLKAAQAEIARLRTVEKELAETKQGQYQIAAIGICHSELVIQSEWK